MTWAIATPVPDTNIRRWLTELAHLVTDAMRVTRRQSPPKPRPHHAHCEAFIEDAALATSCRGRHRPPTKVANRDSVSARRRRSGLARRGGVNRLDGQRLRDDVRDLLNRRRPGSLRQRQRDIDRPVDREPGSAALVGQ